MDFLPVYQSHKTVRAARIVGVDVPTNHLTVETPDGVRHTLFPQLSFFRRAVPNEGDYFVLYQDGYQSHTPAAAFAESCKLAGLLDSRMDFGGALNALRAGKRVARAGWNGKGMWLQHVDPKALGLEVDIELLPWIGMKTADNKFVPWLASQTDMLADDWCVVEG